MHSQVTRPIVHSRSLLFERFGFRCFSPTSFQGERIMAKKAKKAGKKSAKKSAKKAKKK
jgi:hypothetical protein